MPRGSSVSRAVYDDCQRRLHPEVWAKSPNKVALAQGEGLFHPLICHMIDTAMVAQQLWQQVLPVALRKQLCGALGSNTDGEAGLWIAFFVGLHDLGKATPYFASRWPEGWTVLHSLGYQPADARKTVGHGVLTTHLLLTRFKAMGIPGDIAVPVANTVGGHHGHFPPVGALNQAYRHAGGPIWQATQDDLVDALAHGLGIRQLPPPTGNLKGANPLLLILAGLTSVSDWIASDHHRFPFAGGAIDLHSYQQRAADQAATALDRLGWLARPAPKEPQTFQALFGKQPNPLQEQVVALSTHLSGPSLTLLEYPMGGGKTEAALYLADALGTRAGHTGFYFALPTMATSNQMLGRVNDFLQMRFPADWVNVQLLHGHANLNAEFAVLKATGAQMLDPAEVWGEKGAGLMAAQWFTYRKRGLLAPYGIGTIDQALMAVLQTSHFFVRLFGLAGKTIILDEVHAYDTYMQTLLNRLLKWLAACGSSVVLLSATLPEQTRQRLVAAYAAGRGRTATLPAHPYPRLSWVSDADADACHVESDRPRHVLLSSRPQADTGWMTELKDALAEGGCAAVILNTVKRAQAVYQELNRHFAAEEVYLFHARAPYDWRAQWERTVLERFGPEAKNRPHRAVVVATQVIEQSLDLDFDLMVTDLAPIDLLLQRSGRIWRHPRDWRPPELAGPTLWLLMPPVDASGVPHFESGAIRVYDAHLLLRTWRTLADETAFVIPEQVDELIEQVYRPGAAPTTLPEAVQTYWRNTWAELQASASDDEAQAAHRYIPDPTGEFFLNPLDSLVEDDESRHSVFQALTRQGGQPAVNVVCLRSDGQRLYTVGEKQRAIDLERELSAGDLRALLGSSLQISYASRLVGRILELGVPRPWQTSPHLRRHRALLFDQTGTCLSGDLHLRLDEHLGLVLGAAREEEEEP